jgi:hypothetical protein
MEMHVPDKQQRIREPIAEIGREFDKSLEWLLTGCNGE